jgi:hypothetical protein
VTRSRAILLLLLVLAIASAGYHYFFGSSSQFISLDRAGFESFEQQFDRATGRVRVVALLSPT